MQCIYHASHKEVCIFFNRKPIRFQFRICYCQISSSDRLFSAVCTFDCLHFCLLFSFFSPADRQLHGLTLYFFVCFGFCVPLDIFHSYGDVTIADEGLQILTYTRHSWPLSSKGSWACPTYLTRGIPLTKNTIVNCSLL